MVYVALLRGINVGGNSKVDMSKLKESFEKIGLRKVKTYINSGNVIFEDERPEDELTPLIEAAIEKDFGFHVPVVVRDKNSLQKLLEKVPLNWTNDTAQKTDVLFLWSSIDNSEILKKVVINPEIENVLYAEGALIWNIARANVTKGNGIKLIKTDLYKHMTVRNINTVRKLYELMS